MSYSLLANKEKITLVEREREWQKEYDGYIDGGLKIKKEIAIQNFQITDY